MKRVENSALSKVPKEKLRNFQIKFRKGKVQTRNKSNFKFLQNLQFPFSKSGGLRTDFRKLVQQKVINKLPDYCEQAKIRNSGKEKKECSNRAKRIRERVKERLKKQYF